ncbi:hypothetical protein BACI71_30247 [Bacillus mycoides]|uniref:Uncharacterized protein n=1 Tax=Bacillus mycoides TaxID=1405 RepID=A0A653WQE2_BACMY|nr:hypothetical protein BACI71_30247 [Bacillus mycoides]
MLDYGTLCIKTFRVHGFDIIFNYYIDFLLDEITSGFSAEKPGEVITGTKRNHS